MDRKEFVSMEDFLIEILSSFGCPVRRQGSFLENEPYPDSFFTFWSNSADAESIYDNRENAILYEYDVNFYSTDVEKVYGILREAKKKFHIHRKTKCMMTGAKSESANGPLRFR